MFGRMVLDAVAVTAASAAVFVAALQAEHQELRPAALWFPLAVLLAVVVAAQVNIVQVLISS